MDVYRLMSPAKAQEIINEVYEISWYQGRASTDAATGTIKKNLELGRHNNSVNADEFIKTKPHLQFIQQSLLDNVQIMTEHYIYKMLFPKFNRYDANNESLPFKGDGEYQRHSDSWLMGGMSGIRTDLACTIFLTHPDLYVGGVLNIENARGSTVQIKGNPGECVVYPCHWPHWVTPVTQGYRISAITWLQSLLRDLEQRELCRRFQVYAEQARKYDTQLGVSLGTIHGKLLRMWAER